MTLQLTDQIIKCVSGYNYKDLFTRQGQPKTTAFVIKTRYEQLESLQTID